MNSLDTAKAFAGCLDNNDFVGAGRYLSQQCDYLIGDETLVGPQVILSSYESNYLKGKDRLDEIIFSSEVEEQGNGWYTVHYLDRIRKGDRWHAYRCQQLLLVEEGRVTKIRHVEIEGEREKLDAFYQLVEPR